VDRPFESVVAISPTLVVATTSISLHVIYYTLPVVIDTPVWQFDDIHTIYGTFHDEIPSLFMMWAETDTFSGMVLIPHLGILHENVISPLFYPAGYDDGEASAELDHRLHAHKFVAPDGLIAQHTMDSRTYIGKSRGNLQALNCIWRRRSTTVSAVLLHKGGCVSISVPLDTRLGYLTKHAVQRATLSVAHMIKAEGGTSIALYGIGSMETVCICTGRSVAVVDFVYEAGKQPSSTLQIIKLGNTDNWEVEFDGTTFVVRSGTKIREIQCSHLPGRADID